MTSRKVPKLLLRSSLAESEEAGTLSRSQSQHCWAPVLQFQVVGLTGVWELTFLMGRGLGTGTGHKSLNPSFLDSGCKTITLINQIACKALGLFG